MFPLNSNDQYIDSNGKRSKLGDAIGSGGGGSELPEHSAADAGKVLKVADDGSLEWDEEGGAGGVYVGTTNPDPAIGENGDYYYKRFDNTHLILSNAFESSSNTNVYGNEYVINYSGTITKIRVLSADTQTLSVRIGNLTEVLETINDVSCIEDEWKEIELTTPISVTVGDHIIVQMLKDSSPGHFRFSATEPTFYTTFGSFVNSRYGSGYPGSTESNRYVAADFIMSLPYEYVGEQYFKTSGTWSQIG